MIQLLEEDLHIISKFNIPKEDITLKSCLEGVISGKAWVDNKLNPTAAVVIVADFCILLGKVNTEEQSEIVKLLSDNAKRKIIKTENLGWHELIKENFKDVKSFYRYEFKWEPDAFDREQLRSFVSAVQPDFTPVRIDKGLYFKSLQDEFTADFCCFFSSLQKFMDCGIGYVFVKDDEIIAGASSYSASEGAIDITIGTKPEFRRKGLALASAAALILECLDKGIYPLWSAANKESVALAEKLGYHFDREHLVYSIR